MTDVCGVVPCLTHHGMHGAGIDLLDLAEDDLLSMKVFNVDLRQTILTEAQLLVCPPPPYTSPPPLPTFRLNRPTEV